MSHHEPGASTTMAKNNLPVINPTEDPRLEGDDIPYYLFKASQRWSNNSPSSPSIKGFRAASSGLQPHSENRDAFPASLLHLEVFYDNYCEIMDNQDDFKTTTHSHFVGFYSTKTLAEREATLLRKSSTTEYRVYCVRGAALRDMGVSVIRGRAVLSIGRGENKEVIHTDEITGEEYLVWGRVPEQAILGSWGADGMMQFAKIRQEAQRQRGERRFVPYIERYQPGKEVSAEEALDFADSLVKEGRARRIASSRSSNNWLQSKDLAPIYSTSNQFPTALGRPPRQQYQLTERPQKPDAVALLKFPHHLPGLMSVLPPQSQQRPYQSPYVGTKQNAHFNEEALQNMALAPLTSARLGSSPAQPGSVQSPPQGQRPGCSRNGAPRQIGRAEEVARLDVEERKGIQAEAGGDTEDDTDGEI